MRPFYVRYTRFQTLWPAVSAARRFFRSKTEPTEKKGHFPPFKSQNSEKVYKIRWQEHIFGIIFSPSTGGLTEIRIASQEMADICIFRVLKLKFLIKI